MKPATIIMLLALSVSAHSATVLNVMHQRNGRVMAFGWNSAKGAPIVFQRSLDGLAWTPVCTNTLNRASLVKLPGVNYVGVVNK